ncbi:uncharacterized protein LOC133195066 [Saccostrea echinata]|uniref:uncharacterized protein LOC133195066 n=1 Tax=Saccostrea echinata TaxID=191078 RepID=UPI002A8362FE|nr:uncharacterized protein LOC133195066 [Saccostrea echinata]
MSPPNWQWEQEQDISFQKLENSLIHFPILGFPIYGQPFEIHKDASQKGLGAVLYQLQNGQKRVIAYASRGLSKSEKNYFIHKLEFLALKWSITEKFSDYLYGTTFDVITDNNPLTYVLSTAKLDSTSQRWIASLATYDFNIFYRPGKSNADADGLSRLPEISDVRDREQISADTIKRKLIEELCNIMNIQKSRTTPYHPMGNGLCERYNRTLLQMLGTLNMDQKADWKSYIRPLVHVYNCMKQESTQHSPFFLMFGRQPRLPKDIAFNIPTSSSEIPIPKYVESLKSKLKEAYQLATAANQRAQERQKRNYDLKVRSAILEKGDRVLVKITSFDGKHKLADKWESTPYIIVDQPNSTIPVYIVKEEGSNRQRTIHRNLLLPIGYLDFQPTEPRVIRPTPRHRKRLPRKNKRKTPDTKDESESDSSDEEVIWTSPQNHFEGNVTPSDVGTDQADDGQIPAGWTEPAQEDSDVGEVALTLEDKSNTSDASKNCEPEAESHSLQEDPHIEEEVVTDQQDDEISEVVTQEEIENQAKDIQTANIPEEPVRAKTKPAWMKTGEYSMSIQPPIDPDWKLKCNYLDSLVSDNHLSGVDQKQLSSTFLKILLQK